MQIARMRQILTVALCALACASCSVGRKYERPMVVAPGAFRGADNAQSGPTSFGDEKWFDVFQDPQLQSLIRTALQQNYDIRIAAARIVEARARVGIAQAEQYPSAAVIATANNYRYARTKFLNTYETSNTQLGLGLRWSPDFWGKYRNATEAARHDLLADTWAQREVTASLVADLASAYFTLRDLDLRLEISRKTLADNRDSLRLTQLLSDNGATSLLDVRQAEQSVYAAAAAIAGFEKQIDEQENFIHTLMGENPEGVTRGVEVTAQPHLPDIAAGLPSSLLERRPDIQAAEARLVSKNAQIGVARAAYFPDITLTGLGGFQSLALTRLFSGPTGMWTFVGTLTQPLFNAGSLKKNVQLAEAETQEAVLTYQKTIQQSFREVSDALKAYAKDQEFRKQQELLTQAAADAQRLSNMRYQGGFSSYLEVLDTNTRYYSAQVTLARAQLDELLNYVQLYYVLGGGWQ